MKKQKKLPVIPVEEATRYVVRFNEGTYPYLVTSGDTLEFLPEHKYMFLTLAAALVFVGRFEHHPAGSVLGYGGNSPLMGTVEATFSGCGCDGVPHLSGFRQHQQYEDDDIVDGDGPANESLDCFSRDEIATIQGFATAADKLVASLLGGSHGGISPVFARDYYVRSEQLRKLLEGIE